MIVIHTCVVALPVLHFVPIFLQFHPFFLQFSPIVSKFQKFSCPFPLIFLIFPIFPSAENPVRCVGEFGVG